MTLRRTQITDQLRQRLFSGTHLGALAHGHKLPGVRELAEEFDADPRVVMAAYHQLQAEGLVEVRPRSGIFVTATDATEHPLHHRTADWMVEVLMEGLGQGIAARDFPERLRRSLETLRLRATCIECNHDQLVSLAGELHEDYGLDVSAVDTYTLLANGEPPYEVRRADLLVTTPFHIVEVAPVAAALGKPYIVAEVRVDLFAEVARRLRAGPVWFVVSDPRFVDKLYRIYEGAPGGGHLRPLVVGQDDLRKIPPDAPVYVTRLARERAEPGSLPAQCFFESRVFSRETSRQLFSFIVGANTVRADGHAVAP
ncbi:MAG: GntR family transcriptional regulator [Gemmatimonadales bacterium]|nr:GntR family transcriptional regulator [Gemmatimonadales bacterium]